LGQNPNNFKFPKGKKIVKSKKTKSQLNQAQVDVSKSKIESEVKAHPKVIKKIDHNNFHRALEAFSDCV
jgi:hypothetical protein